MQALKRIMAECGQIHRRFASVVLKTPLGNALDATDQYSAPLQIALGGVDITYRCCVILAAQLDLEN